MRFVRRLGGAACSLDGVTLFLIVLAGLTCAIIVVVLCAPPKIIGYDFLAFWCGGRAVLAGANPYLNQPLHSCEIVHAPNFFYDFPNVTVPAPLPPYALALFAPLSLVPYAIARALWWAFILACVALEARFVARLAGRSYAFGAIVCGFAMTAPIVLQGALAPLPVTLLTAGAYALRNERWRSGSAFIAAAMIEPHMALPAALAAFLFLPKTRLPLIACASIALSLALIAVGPHVLGSYFTSVLPVHALSELDNLGQDSLTTILHHLGLADGPAIHIGGLQYAVFAIVGIVFSGRLLRREHDASWAVVVPAAFAMIGGEFVHLSEVSMAIPLAAVLAVRLGGWNWLPLMMLALPGEAAINYGTFFVPAMLVIALLLRDVHASSRSIIAASIIVGGLSIIGHAFAIAEIGTNVRAIGDPGATALASVSWAAWNRLAFIGPVWWVEKIFTLFPLLVLAASTARYAYRAPIAVRREGRMGQERSAAMT